MLLLINFVKFVFYLLNMKAIYSATTALFLCLISISSYAQDEKSKHLQDHKPLMNEVWKTFDLMMYKVTKTNGKTIYTPYFPPKLQQLNGKRVQLKGYMIPIKSGMRHNSFLLSVLPLHQCMFCGQDGIPAMVQVTLSGDAKERAREHPITITGVISLNAADKNKTEILLEKASLL